MRYQIGQIVPFLYFTLVREDGTIYRSYLDHRQGFFHQGLKFQDVTAELYECVRHEKVTNGYSDEKNYDGFIFKNMKGQIYHNQYPTASYGQLDDTSDGLISFGEEKFEEEVASFGGFDSYPLHRMDARRYLRTNLRGVYDLSKNKKGNIPTDEIIKDLEMLYALVEKKILDLGYKTIKEPHIMKAHHGRPEHLIEGLYDITFEKI